MDVTEEYRETDTSKNLGGQYSDIRKGRRLKGWHAIGSANL